jgi:ribosomal-protein-alanine N-acetyltransferase
MRNNEFHHVIEGRLLMFTPKLETKRLMLRQIKNEDVDAIFNCWMQDEDVSRYMYWKASKDIKETQEFIRYELGNIENDKWYRWIIVLKQTDEIIGTCLIYYNDEENNWDISYNLGKTYWGKGYITEAMNQVMEYAINELKIKECIAIHAIENPESGRVIQKLGFSYEKLVPYECNGGEINTTGKYYKFVAK